jgi:hypothetical protein
MALPIELGAQPDGLGVASGNAKVDVGEGEAVGEEPNSGAIDGDGVPVGVADGVGVELGVGVGSGGIMFSQ